MLAPVFAVSSDDAPIDPYAIEASYEPPQYHLRDPGGFLSGPSTGTPLEIAVDYLKTQASELGLTAGDLDEFVVTDQYTSGHNGVTHIYLRQTHGGLEVSGADVHVNLTADGRVINVASSFLPGLDETARAPDVPLGLGASEALTRLAADLALPPVAAPQSALAAPPTLDPQPELSQQTVLAARDISLEDVPASLHYVPTPDGGVELAWKLNVQTTDGQHWYDAAVSAVDGELLSCDDWVHGVGQGSYNVFALPLGGPDDGGRSLLTSVADPDASPFGWHDTNGIAGAEYYDTRGNNVFAQEDRDANDSGGFRPHGGANLQFDFPLDLADQPTSYEAAAVANLFYWNNVLHDVHYQYGFDEAAGNFQDNNYGRGGLGGDAVQADAQDGSDVGNATFATPPDGSSPRMQMFLWPRGNANVAVTSPAGIAGDYAATPAVFGPALTPSGISGEFVLAEPALGCDPLTNPEAIAGKIAVIDRGDCYFVVKVKNAQDAGAIGVLMINNVSGQPVIMGGEDPTITIPAAMVSRQVGDRIKSALAAGPVYGTLSQPDLTSRDSDFDNAIIIHEYGHGVSLRLTGGPSTVNALGGTQSDGMGEGWSDWWALMLTQTADDDQMDAYPIGSYASFGMGLRRYAYSFDVSIDPLTYADIAQSPVVHDVGEIWASALWDLNWLLIEGDGVATAGMGFDPDLYHGTGGNNVALQLVLDGLKLQPSHPTMLDARDAILLADTVNHGGANHRAIWTAFARRGMGLGADDGGDHNSTAVVEAFDMPAMPQVVGREVFYNNSAFDVAGDDQAIATDKAALLPGQAAGFHNVTSYDRGINGVIVDVIDLPAAGPAIDAADYFEFRVGNDDDPDGWIDAPDPIDATVRPGEGPGGSDRITLVWDDHAIGQQWLQVTVLANAATGLDEPDVFYFGNAVGESGNMADDLRVNAVDVLLARNNPHSLIDPAPIDFAFDYNRDQRVNATDLLLARNHQTHFLDALRLINVPTGKAELPLSPAVDDAPPPVDDDQPKSPATSLELDWLYEFVPADGPTASSEKASAVEATPDELLASFWTQNVF